MELMQMTGELMPSGKPNFLSVVKYPTVKSIVSEMGYKETLVVLTLLVKDFCASFNVVRNMNEEQMIEAAAMLIEEADNFRIEDYVMMFQMAKKGELVKIMDRIDLQKITEMLDEYWIRRNDAGEKKIVEEYTYFDSLGDSQKLIETLHIQDAKLIDAASGFASELNKIKDLVETKIGNKEERARLKEIEIEDTKKIQEQLKAKGY